MDCHEIDAMLHAQLDGLDGEVAVLAGEVHALQGLALPPALPLSEAMAQLQAAADGLAGAWEHSAAALERDVRPALQRMAEEAIGAVGAVQLAMGSVQTRCEQAYAHALSLVTDFDTVTVATGQTIEQTFSGMSDAVTDSADSYRQSLSMLALAMGSLETAVAEQLVPGLIKGLGGIGTDTLAYADSTLPQLAETLQSAFSQEVRAYMELNERASNAFADGLRAAKDELTHFTEDRIAAMLDRSLDRLKESVITIVEKAIIDAIVQANVNVAVTSALGSIMPQLILIKHALPAIEQAIKAYKEMLRVASLGIA